MPLNLSSNTFNTNLRKPPPRAGRKVERQGGHAVDGWASSKGLWKLIIKFSGNLQASSYTTGDLKSATVKLANTTDQPSPLPQAGCSSLPAHHCTVSAFSPSLFWPSWRSLFPVSHWEELMMHQEESWERKTWSPREISTTRPLKFTHPFSHCCVFRLHLVTRSVNTSYVEQHLVFTRRNQGFP